MSTVVAVVTTSQVQFAWIGAGSEQRGGRRPMTTVADSEERSKWFSPKGTHEELEITREVRASFSALLHESRRGHYAALNVGIWDPITRLARISAPKGAHFHAIGAASQGIIHLQWQETLFLIERNSLALYHNDGIVSAQHAFELVLPKQNRSYLLPSYSIYAYLKRLGFILFPREATLPAVDQAGLSVACTLRTAFSTLCNGFLQWLRRVGIILSRPYNPWPLVAAHNWHYYDEVLKAISIIPRAPFLVAKCDKESLTSVYDVYKPNPSFRKSDRPKMDFGVVVQNIHQPCVVPGLMSLFVDCQMRVGVVDGANGLL
ncbi:hypothetical protein DFS34DRAFT_460302 [Phlyctochytrium arcticum]|nr:hypothetical protein DFS34DRAFT_460302 [Phlyctochytrium arcticum]